MQPIFSLLYTTRRPKSIPEVVNLWRSKAHRPDRVEIIITVDGDDKESAEVARQTPGVDKVIVVDKPPFNCVHGWNVAGEHSTGLVLIAIADDFYPPQNYDTLLSNVVPDKNDVINRRMSEGKDYPSWMDEDRVVHTEDGYVHDIFVLAIQTRVRYKKFGYVFYPGYESLFSDTEFGYRAKMDGVVIEAPHLLFEHRHPDCNKRPRDSVDLKHASRERWDRGEALFNKRKSMGFPMDKNIEMTEEKENNRYAAYIQATKDDFCLYEVCCRLHESGVRDFFFCIPDEYWNGKITPQEEIKQVIDVADRVKKLQDSVVKHRIFHVPDYRRPGKQIVTETALRNDSLKWIRETGIKHILIVDGDELWINNLLLYVDKAVKQYSPKCIGCNMIPVVGLPGYPIGRAVDIVTIYVGMGSEFTECRSVGGNRLLLNMPGVIHFTATRKTMEEIVEKHLSSGHYDDPNYDFDGWIKNTLPNIKPGLTNVHMYKPYQIWPYVRNWTMAEMLQIPESLHQYLGKPVDSGIRGNSVSSAMESTADVPSVPSVVHIPVKKADPYKKNRTTHFCGFNNNIFKDASGHPARV